MLLFQGNLQTFLGFFGAALHHNRLAFHLCPVGELHGQGRLRRTW